MNRPKGQEMFRVLLVEDNAGDVFLVKQALKHIGAPVHLDVVESGPLALECLYRTGYRPSLVILDLNLPQMSGREVLEKIKSDPGLCEIPVVIFSSSTAVSDVRAAYRAHANTYFQKPADVDEFFAVIAGMERYWNHLAILPPG